MLTFLDIVLTFRNAGISVDVPADGNAILSPRR